MTDWKWRLWCALPYGILALALHVIGPAKALLWLGIQLEMAGMAVQDLAVALQTIFGYQRTAAAARIARMADRLRAAREEGEASANSGT